MSIDQLLGPPQGLGRSTRRGLFLTVCGLGGLLAAQSALAAPRNGGLCSLDGTTVDTANLKGCLSNADCGAGRTCILPAAGQGPVQAPQASSCVEDVLGTPVNCTANDVTVAEVTDVSIVTPCTKPGDVAVVNAVVALQSNSNQERFDIGGFIAADGQDSLTGSCTIAALPGLPEPAWLDDDGDVCGEIDPNLRRYAYLVDLPIACIDADQDGFADVSAVLTWKQPGGNPTCSSATDVVPGTKSKCRFENLQGLAVPVPPAGFTVYKDFVPNNPTGSVTITLSCTSGTITQNGLTATEAQPAIFEVTGYQQGATCTATETVPTGYLADQSGCNPPGGISLETGARSCTMVNTLNTGQFTVVKDFSDDNATDSVTVNLTCTSGRVTNNPQQASEGTPAVFTIEGYTTSPVPTCTATESGVPAGYTPDDRDCQDGDPIGGNCTLVNTLNTGTFTVNKDFSDGNAAAVTVNLTCTSGTVAANGLPASEGSPAVFTVNGITAGTTCTASESGVPAGYTPDDSDCQDGDPIGGSCTLVNRPVAPRPIPALPVIGLGMLALLLGAIPFFRRRRG